MDVINENSKKELAFYNRVVYYKLLGKTSKILQLLDFFDEDLQIRPITKGEQNTRLLLFLGSIGDENLHLYAITGTAADWSAIIHSISRKKKGVAAMGFAL